MTEQKASLGSLQSLAFEFGISLVPVQIAALERYRNEIVSRNQRSNLTAVRDPDAIDRTLILETLRLLPFVISSDDARPHRLIDVGTGAGIPGIPLQIVGGARLEVVLLDSNGKKTSFLSHVVDTVGPSLSGIRVVNMRAEEAARIHGHRESYDRVTARAVGSIALLAELCLPFVRPGGTVVLPRGRDAIDEANAAAGAIEAVGGRFRGPSNVDDSDTSGSIVVLEKVMPTPDRFPRRTGIPKKRPL